MTTTADLTIGRLHANSLDNGWEQRRPTADHPQQALAIPPKIFEHRALLYTPDLKPISEVDETYTSENLAFAPPHRAIRYIFALDAR